MDTFYLCLGAILLIGVIILITLSVHALIDLFKTITKLWK